VWILRVGRVLADGGLAFLGLRHGVQATDSDALMSVYACVCVICVYHVCIMCIMCVCVYHVYHVCMCVCTVYVCVCVYVYVYVV